MFGPERVLTLLKEVYVENEDLCTQCETTQLLSMEFEIDSLSYLHGCPCFVFGHKFNEGESFDLSSVFEARKACERKNK